MNIVNFTPISALSGGLLIGLSVALFFILKGRMIGISGIASNFLVSKDNRIENFLFLVGLILTHLTQEVNFAMWDIVIDQLHFIKQLIKRTI